MLRMVLDFVAKKIGRSGYELDVGFNKMDLLELIVTKILQEFRFMLFKFRLREAGWINFFGHGITVSFARHMSIGRGVFLGNNVSINALCRSGVCIGNNVTIKAGTKIDCSGVYSELGEGIIIGDRVGISENCFIQVRGKVHIEDDVIIGPSVMIFSENHLFGDNSKHIRQQGTSRTGVRIGSGAWLGAGATILDGVIIGAGAVIAAGAVVTKNIEPRTVVAGNPARMLMKLN